MSDASGTDPTIVAGLVTELSIQRFLFDEARLLDAGAHTAWLELFAPVCTYRICCWELVSEQRRGGKPPQPKPLVMAEDDRERLGLRVQRLERGLAGAERPASITRRLITNITTDLRSPDEAVVRSHVQIHQVRYDEHTIVGTREDLLVRADASWRIASRDITLDHTSLPRTVTQLL